MAILISFPVRPVSAPMPEPSLREILRAQGIECTEDERRRKRRERAAGRRAGKAANPSHLPNASTVD